MRFKVVSQSNVRVTGQPVTAEVVILFKVRGVMNSLTRHMRYDPDRRVFIGNLLSPDDQGFICHPNELEGLK